MGQLATTINQPILIDLPSDYRDTGWSISGKIATHFPCNAGSMRSKKVTIFAGETYTVKYNVIGYQSGMVQARLGGVSGQAVSANGEYTDTLTAVTNETLSLFSDGYLSVQFLSAYSPSITGETPGRTIAFNEKLNAWTGDYSFVPEQMIKFIDKFFTIKSGALWLHHENQLKNNFYGVQYTSKIVYYVNINPSQVKNFHSQRIQSNKPWGSPNKGDILLFPTERKPDGQKSRLKSGNYNNLQGDYFADFLRDMDDPRFTSELESLMKGGLLQGKVMQVTVENTDVTEVRLTSIDTVTSLQNYTY